MIARVRQWWRREASPAPDPDFAARMRNEAKAAARMKREVVHRRIQRNAECPLVSDVFHDPPRRERRQEP